MFKFKYLLIFILLFPLGLRAEENFVLPEPGMTPNNPIYFLDLWGEKIQEWLTFNPVAKAKLNVEFAAERVAETRELLKTRDFNSKGLNIVLDSLDKNKNKVSAWLNKSKEKNINVDNVTADLNNKLSNVTKMRNEIFITGIKSLADWRSDLQLLLVRAEQNNQTTMIDGFKKQLEKIDAQISLIESKMTSSVIPNLTGDPESEIDLTAKDIKKEKITNKSLPAKSADKPSAAKIKAEATLQGLRQLKAQIDDLAAEAGVEIDEATFENYNLFYPQIEKNIAEGNYTQAEQTAASLREELASIEQELKDYIAGN